MTTDKYKKLTSEAFIKMLINGAGEVIKNADLINSINVFPVPDADTGSNMSKTLQGFKKVLEDNDGLDFLELKEKALGQALISSQGNSGIMITSYLSGLLGQINKFEKIEDIFVHFKNAANIAREAVENPTDGTMLDVMDCFADSLANSNSIEISLDNSFKSLIETESKMKLLSKNHVVDSGALGFTIFIFAFFGKELNLSEVDLNPVGKITDQDFGEYPYEVVFIAKTNGLKTESIKDMFAPLGDSIDTVEIEGKLKLHIHTNEPDLVAQTASLVGDIERIDTVDMRHSQVNHTN